MRIVLGILFIGLLSSCVSESGSNTDRNLLFGSSSNTHTSQQTTVPQIRFTSSNTSSADINIPVSSSSYTIQFTTQVRAECYSTEDIAATSDISTMDRAFQTGGQTHRVRKTDLRPNTRHEIFAKCVSVDTLEEMPEVATFNFTVGDSVDEQPPVINPTTFVPSSGEVFSAQTTSVNLQVYTSEGSFCRYSESNATPFGQMQIMKFSNGALTHVHPYQVNPDSVYFIYVRCRDQAGNEGTDSRLLTFSIEAEQVVLPPTPRPNIIDWEPRGLQHVDTSVVQLVVKTSAAGQCSFSPTSTNPTSLMSTSNSIDHFVSVSIAPGSNNFNIKCRNNGVESDILSIKILRDDPTVNPTTNIISATLPSGALYPHDVTSITANVSVTPEAICRYSNGNKSFDHMIPYQSNEIDSATHIFSLSKQQFGWEPSENYEVFFKCKANDVISQPRSVSFSIGDRPDEQAPRVLSASPVENQVFDPGEASVFTVTINIRTDEPATCAVNTDLGGSFISSGFITNHFFSYNVNTVEGHDLNDEITFECFDQNSNTSSAQTNRFRILGLRDNDAPSITSHSPTDEIPNISTVNVMVVVDDNDVESCKLDSQNQFSYDNAQFTLIQNSGNARQFSRNFSRAELLDNPLMFARCVDDAGNFSTISGQDDYIIDLQLGDPYAELAWHLNNTGLNPELWLLNPRVGNDLNMPNIGSSNYFTGSGVKVAVVDDGIEKNHEDLEANIGLDHKFYRSNSPSSWPSTNPTPPSSDSHGTSVSGIIGAVKNNGLGSHGIAPNVSLHGLVFLSSASVADPSTSVFADIANGDFDIFNNSWGTSDPSVYISKEEDGSGNLVDSALTVYKDMVVNQGQNGRDGKGSIYIKSAGNSSGDSIRFNPATEDILGNNQYGLIINYADQNGDPATGVIVYPHLGTSMMEPAHNEPEMIVVAAANSDNQRSSYSSFGSNIWVSGYGGELTSRFEAAEFSQSAAPELYMPGVFTTSFSSCNPVNALFSDFERGLLGNTDCKYTAAFKGTSAAAPTVSGVVALMLEANPNLTNRQVKDILARTATPISERAEANAGSNTHPFSRSDLSSFLFFEQTRWTNSNGQFLYYHGPTNSGFFPRSFSNHVGFGLVNATAAVEGALNPPALAPQVRSRVSQEFSQANQTTIPNSAQEFSLNFNSGPNTVEQIQLDLWINHDLVGEVGIELISPMGTVSTIMPYNNMAFGDTNTANGIRGYNGTRFLSNAFYNEPARGTWRLRLVDGLGDHSRSVLLVGQNPAGEIVIVDTGDNVTINNQGELLRWDLTVIGH